MKLNKEIKDGYIKYITEGIEHTIKSYGDRDPGSEGERKAQEYMSSEAEKFLGEKPTMEEFKVTPHSFFAWLPILATFMLVAYILYWFIPILTPILIIAGFIPMLAQFVLYKKFLDPFFKEKTSVNVFGTKKPEGEVKRRIFLCGHVDATWEWTYLYKFGAFGFNFMFVINVISMLFLFAISILFSINHFVDINLTETLKIVLGCISGALMPFAFGLYFFSNSRRVVPGANDNLSACFLSLALVKALKEENIKLENTEIGVMLVGSEEAGLRGTKAFCEKHKDDFKDVETIFVNFETLRELDCLSIYNRDLNGLVKTDMGVCKLLMDAADEAEIKVKYATVTVGATDSAGFTQGGMKSACLAGLSHMLKRYYHTRLDDYDNLNEKCLTAAFDIGLNAILNYDKNGLPKVDKLKK